MRLEDELLIAMSRRDLNVSIIQRMLEIFSEECDWSYWLERVIGHRMGPLCYLHLQTLGKELPQRVHSRVMNTLTLSYHRTLFRNATIVDELKTISDALHQEDIGFLVLKGPVLAARMYRNLGLRPFADIDLLVRSNEIDKVCEIMQAHGYLFKFATMKKEGGITPTPSLVQHERKRKIHLEFRKKVSKIGISFLSIFEIHHRLVYPSAPYNLEIQKLFKEIDRVKIRKDFYVDTLSPEYFLISLCEHLYKHATGRSSIFKGQDIELLRFCDIYETINHFGDALSWKRIGDIIASNSLVDPVIFSLLQTREVYGPTFEIPLFKKHISEDSRLIDTFFGNNQFGPTKYYWRTEFRNRVFCDSRVDEAKLILEDEKPKSGILHCKKIKKLKEENWPRSWCGIETVMIRESQVPKWQPFGTHVHAGDPPINDAQLSAFFSICWNKEFLFIRLKVNDDNVVPYEIQDNDVHPQFLRDQDSVVLLFGLEKNVKRLYFLLRPDLKDGSLCIEQDKNKEKIESRIVNNVRTKGYIHDKGYEIWARIPTLLLHISPIVGTRIGFDILIYDCDNKKEGIKREMVWAGGEGRYGLSNESWRYELGELIFQ